MKSITVSELKQWMDEGKDFQLIDVREDMEYEAGNLNAVHIPMGDIPDNIDRISKDKQVVIHCRSGARSGRICQFLESSYGFDQVYNLEGGIMAWAAEIDSSVRVA